MDRTDARWPRPARCAFSDRFSAQPCREISPTGGPFTERRRRPPFRRRRRVGIRPGRRRRSSRSRRRGRSSSRRARSAGRLTPLLHTGDLLSVMDPGASSIDTAQTQTNSRGIAEDTCIYKITVFISAKYYSTPHTARHSPQTNSW